MRLISGWKMFSDKFVSSLACLLQGDGPCPVVGEDVADDASALFYVLMRRPSGTQTHIRVGGVPEERFRVGFLLRTQNQSFHLHHVRSGQLFLQRRPVACQPTAARGSFLQIFQRVRPGEAPAGALPEALLRTTPLNHARNGCLCQRQTPACECRYPCSRQAPRVPCRMARLYGIHRVSRNNNAILR